MLNETEKAAALKIVLPGWAADCERTYPDCTAVWNKTAGTALGLAIE